MKKEKLALAKVIEEEISDYFSKTIETQPGVTFSQPAIVKRIGLFESHTYPTGKFDKQGNYKYWYDIITPRVDSEVKNIDFDTKNIEIYSPLKMDEVADTIANLKLRQFLKDSGKEEELNSAIEEGSGWGNVVWKKVKDGYERVDLRNFYVINQSARTLNQSPVIERHQLTSTEVRARNKWKNIDEVLKTCGQNIYKSNVESTQEDTTTPIYTFYERNGEVSLYDLKQAMGETPTKEDKNKYVFAKVIGAGTEGTAGGVKIKYLVFAQNLDGMTNSDIYKEYHRGRYKNRWWREGLYELLFDCQVRANEIGNQIAQGLQYASKIIFTGDDKQIIQNVTTDLKNGDYIRGQNLRQVEVRLQGFDQLANDWNRILELANEIANSREVVQGITPASGTPLGTSQLLNTNANKLYDFIREKFAIPFREIFEQWVVPELVKELKTSDILRLSGDSKLLDRMKEYIVNDWYANNLINLGPHTPEIAEAVKAQKMEELSEKKELFLQGAKAAFENYKARVSVVITGENTRRLEERDAFAQFVPLEADPVRRSAMVEEAMRRNGIDVGSLPKSEPEQLAGVVPSEPRQPERATIGA